MLIIQPENQYTKTIGDSMKNEDLKSIGIRIAQQRKKLNLTQEQIAEYMNVSIQMISNLERGNKAIKIDNLIKLCSILKTSTDYILTGKHSNNDVDKLTDKISKLNECDYEMIEMIIDYRLKNL